MLRSTVSGTSQCALCGRAFAQGGRGNPVRLRSVTVVPDVQALVALAGVLLPLGGRVCQAHIQRLRDTGVPDWDPDATRRKRAADGAPRRLLQPASYTEVAEFQAQLATPPEAPRKACKELPGKVEQLQARLDAIVQRGGSGGSGGSGDGDAAREVNSALRSELGAFVRGLDPAEKKAGDGRSAVELQVALLMEPMAPEAEQRCSALTGLTPAQLRTVFERIGHDLASRVIDGKKRPDGGGDEKRQRCRVRRVDERAMLLLTLLRMRLNLSLPVVAALAQITESHASKMIKLMISVLCQCLVAPLVRLPAEADPSKAPVAAELVLVPTQQPRGQDVAATFWSEQEKGHVAKVLVVGGADGYVYGVHAGFGGATPDADVLRHVLQDSASGLRSFLAWSRRPLATDAALRACAKDFPDIVFAPPGNDCSHVRALMAARMHAFGVLSNTLPIPMVPQLGDLAGVCAALVNVVSAPAAAAPAPSAPVAAATPGPVPG